jgi:hypothetical protein
LSEAAVSGVEFDKKPKQQSKNGLSAMTRNCVHFSVTQ